MYNMGFAIFAVFSIRLSITRLHGRGAALFMIVMRLMQGVGGAFIMANTAAMLSDAFPPNQRGLALGTNSVAGIAGSFIGLVLGGVLGPIDWRLVFWVSVPVGIIGTLWGVLKLKDKGTRRPVKIDWFGNAAFAVGLIAVLSGLSTVSNPYDGQTMGWANPWVLVSLVGGVTMSSLFVWIETRVSAPMFHIPLFKIRAFTAGNVASLMAALGRGGLMFILIIWLQGIWLPTHGYSFSQTPLWAGILMLPLTGGFLLAGPLSGDLSDRYGARPFATVGMRPLSASGCWSYSRSTSHTPGSPFFIGANGLSRGLFASPNRAAVMSSVPPGQRGQSSGMGATIMNSAMVLSVGIFFSVIIVGLSADLPATLYQGLTAHGVDVTAARKVADLPPTSSVFSAFLGYNPVRSMLAPTGVLVHLKPGQAAFLAGRAFFPKRIAVRFAHGLHEALDFAVAACLVPVAASAVMGRQYFHKEPTEATSTPDMDRLVTGDLPVASEHANRSEPADSGGDCC